MLRPRFQILLIILVALSVFYPTLFAEFCPVDDVQLVNSFKEIKTISIRNLFIPGASGGLYYRPFIFVSFLFDRFFLGLDSFAMHFHNVALHALNAVLLYWIAVKVGKRINCEAPFVPLFVSMLFLVHPITTESVNWVSGRTDLLAGTFLLASTGLLLEYKNNNKRVFIYSSIIFFIGAVLTKEFSLAFLPGFVLLATYKNSNITTFKTKILLILLGASVLGLFFLLRAMAYSSNAFPISTTLKVIFNTPDRSLQLILTGIGFYFKKLFIPMPLNFAIFEVNALYEIVAWPILALLVFIAWQRTLLSIFFVTGICLISPAFVIIFNQIAWTPFAERYLYIASAFTTLSSIYYLRKHLEFPNNVSRSISASVVLIIFTVSTFQRNMVWQTAFGIVKDTVLKSPDSTTLKFVYVSFLISRNEHAQARQILATVKSSSGFFYEELGDLCEVDILLREKKRLEAILLLEQVDKNSGNKSTKALDALIELYQEEDKYNQSASVFYRNKIIEARKKLYHVTHNASILYDLGNDLYLIGDKHKAKIYFNLVKCTLPLHDPIHVQSKEKLQKLFPE